MRYKPGRLRPDRQKQRLPEHCPDCRNLSNANRLVVRVYDVYGKSYPLSYYRKKPDGRVKRIIEGDFGET